MGTILCCTIDINCNDNAIEKSIILSDKHSYSLIFASFFFSQYLFKFCSIQKEINEMKKMIERVEKGAHECAFVVQSFYIDC